MATSQERQNLACNIRRFREQQKLTQEELAEIAGVTRNAVDQWEEGNYIPNVISAVAIAKQFGTTAEALVKGKAENFLDEKSNK